MLRLFQRLLAACASALCACVALAQEQPVHPVPDPVRRLSWNTMFIMLIVLVTGTTVALIMMRRNTRRALGLGERSRRERRDTPDPWREAARRAEPAPVDPTLDFGEDRLAANDPDDGAGGPSLDRRDA